MADVFIIGAAKSATTSLAFMLDRHPSISLGIVKEPNFFSHNSNFAKGIEWYARNFKNIERDILALDASTGYTRYPQCPDTVERLHQFVPQAKLIYIMRHPVDRAYSHYVHRWSKELHPGEPFTVSFEEHVQHDRMCIDSSNYRLQILKFLECFPEESILCLFTHELKEDPDKKVREICRFLEISDELPEDIHENSGQNVTNDFLRSRVHVDLVARIKSLPVLGKMAYLFPSGMRKAGLRILGKSFLGRRIRKRYTPPPMLETTRAQLLEYYRDSNSWVAAFTGKDLSIWDR